MEIQGNKTSQTLKKLVKMCLKEDKEIAGCIQTSEQGENENVIDIIDLPLY